jgi:hypothetical protein
MLTDHAEVQLEFFCHINTTNAMATWQVRAACIYRSTHTYTNVYTY